MPTTTAIPAQKAQVSAEPEPETEPETKSVPATSVPTAVDKNAALGPLPPPIPMFKMESLPPKIPILENIEHDQNGDGSFGALLPSLNKFMFSPADSDKKLKKEKANPKSKDSKDSKVRVKQEKGKKWQCEHCAYSTKRKWDLRHHLQTHKGLTSKLLKPIRTQKVPFEQRRHKCEHCDYASNSKAAVRSHMRVHSDAKPLKCTECEFTTKWQRALVVHTMQHRGEKPYECPKCKRRFTQKGNRDSHEKKCKK